MSTHTKGQETFVNRYWEGRLEDEHHITRLEMTLELYQQTFSYLLAQPWYVERLPEIRKHVQENVISKQ